jgi:hypothetical protein
MERQHQGDEMNSFLRVLWRSIGAAMVIALLACIAGIPLNAQELSLQAVVTPSTVIEKNGESVKFAIHGLIELKSLAEVFPYIEAQKQRWSGDISEEG